MATTKGRNYSILVGIKLDTSDVQKQLDAIKGIEIKVKVSVEGNEELKETAETMGQLPKRSKTIKEETDKATDSIKDQADGVEIIGMMVDSVFELDDAITAFKKVSDLGGQSLDNYVEKLTQMGLEVGRTGKP